VGNRSLLSILFVCFQTRSPEFKHTLPAQLRSIKTDKAELWTTAFQQVESQVTDTRGAARMRLKRQCPTPKKLVKISISTVRKQTEETVALIGGRGRQFNGSRKKFALKITICPKHKQYAPKLTFLF